MVQASAVDATFTAIQDFLVGRFGWFYILSMTGFVIFVVWLAWSPFGNVKLGPDDCEPQFSLPTWFAMLFSAGMGIGLLFYSVAEPLMHYDQPYGPAIYLSDSVTSPDLTAETNSNLAKRKLVNIPAARHAMGLTFFHWGLHPWAAYAIVGLSLAYFGFRRGLTLSIRSAFYPLLKERIHGRIGDAIDIMAIVSTMFGVATSLGLGAMQVNAGLNKVAGLPESITVQLVLIAAITAMATASVVSGLDVGIRRLSELNMAVAGLLLAFVFLTGPTFFLLNAFVENLGTYVQHLPVNSFFTATFAQPGRREWLSNWTVFYWAWWIAWSPFVGMFIARISRGRTIREFVLGAFVGPPFAAFIWLTVFGNTALHEEIFGAGGIVASVNDSVPKSLFVLLERLPVPAITSVAATICVILFFVTSSDSASLVIDTIASGGNEDPPVAQRIYWAIKEGVVAALLLLAGGLTALQTAAITTAMPFCLVVIAMCYSLVRGLQEEPISSPTTNPSVPDSQTSEEPATFKVES